MTSDLLPGWICILTICSLTKCMEVTKQIHSLFSGDIIHILHSAKFSLKFSCNMYLYNLPKTCMNYLDFPLSN